MEKVNFKGKIANKDEYIKNLLKGLLANYLEKAFNNSTIKLENLYVISYDKVITLIKNCVLNKVALIKYEKRRLSNEIRFDFG